MYRFLFIALTAVLLSPAAAIADTYDALCNDNNCQITINESGLAGPQGLIANEKITQWHTGGDEYNLASGAAGCTVGLVVGTVACMTGVFSPVALAVGVFGGEKTGARLGNVKNFFFTVMGQQDDG